jgi:hypothetical protein
VIVRRLIVPLTLAAIALATAQAVAQDAVPAPPPGAASERDSCVNGFAPLREEAEQRGKLIKAASERRAAPDEACKLIGAYTQAELKMIKYLETHASKCGIPPTVLEQLKNGHKNSENMQEKVCSAATQMQARGGPAGPSLNDVLGSPRRKPAGPVGDFDTVR